MTTPTKTQISEYVKTLNDVLQNLHEQIETAYLITLNDTLSDEFQIVAKLRDVFSKQTETQKDADPMTHKTINVSKYVAEIIIDDAPPAPVNIISFTEPAEKLAAWVEELEFLSRTYAIQTGGLLLQVAQIIKNNIPDRALK